MVDTIRTPGTSSRRGSDGKMKCWIKLVTSVDVGATNGFGFNGDFYDRAKLYNSSVFPDGCVILECAGNDGSAKYPEVLMVVWQRQGDNFVEITRASGEEWAFALRDGVASLLGANIVFDELGEPEPTVTISRFDFLCLMSAATRAGHDLCLAMDTDNGLLALIDRLAEKYKAELTTPTN